MEDSVLYLPQSKAVGANYVPALLHGGPSVHSMEEMMAKMAMPHVQVPMIGQIEPFLGNSVEDVEEWRSHFEKIAACNKWDDSQALIMMMASLHGQARNWLKSLPNNEKADYSNLMAAMLEEFGERNRMKAFLEMHEKRQLPGESVENYAYGLKRLMMRNNKNMSEEEKINIFVKGLQPLMRTHVVRKRCKTLEEAIEIARDEQRIQETNESLGERRVTNQDLLKRLEDLAHINETLRQKWKEQDIARNYLVQENRQKEPRKTPDDFHENQNERRRKTYGIDSRQGRGRGRGMINQSSRTEDGRLICYRCRKPGHIAQNCFSQNRPWNNNQERSFNGRNQTWSKPNKSPTVNTVVTPKQ